MPLFTIFCCIIFAARVFSQSTSTQTSQVSLTHAKGLSTQGPDLPILFNAEGIFIASKGKQRHFDRWTTKASMLDHFQLYRMQQARHGAHSYKAIPQKCNWGDRSTALGMSTLPANNWTVMVEMEPINPFQKKIGEGLIPVPKIRTILTEDSQMRHALEGEVNESRAWSYFHPAIHPSGKLLVYCGTREDKERQHVPDGTGGVDLYFTVLRRGSWSPPEKFDSRVNSPEDELFASFNSDGVLYFSSNRLGGLGGHDYYRVELDLSAMIEARPNTAWWKPARHLPAPLSSTGDDLALVWRSDAGSKAQTGCLARSLKPGGLDTDIYFFTYNGPLASGVILSETDHSPLPGAQAIFISSTGDTISATADDRGHYEALLQYGKAYRLRHEADMHLASTPQVLTTTAMPQGADLDIGATTLTSVIPPTNTIKGTITSLNGRNLLRQASISFFAPDSDEVSPRMELRDDHFIVEADRNIDFYIDVSVATNAENTFHYIPEAYQAGDTVYADIIMDDSNVQLKRIIIALEGTEGVPGIPVAKLLYFPPNQAEPTMLGWDISTDFQSVRMGMPLPQTRRCSLVVARTGFVPAVIDPRKLTFLPDTVRLVSVEERYLKPIIIYHKLNDQLPDVEISAGELEGISQYLIQEPEARLQITAHTDCRGSDAYNLSLSRRRAERVKAYILRRTDMAFANRIAALGVGESAPAQSCDCVQSCSEEVHSANRRTEILLARPDSESGLYSGQ